jgi:uncharacterized membrane protein
MTAHDPSTPGGLSPSVRARRAIDERRIGRLLIAITYVAVAVLLVGVALMLVNGISPLDAPPVMDLDGVVSGISSLEPAAVLLVGIALVIATPIIRVLAAAVTYARSGEIRMLAVSVGILVVILVGVVSAALTGDPAA